MKPSHQAHLQLLAARGMEAASRKSAPLHAGKPPPAPRVITGESCPDCRGGVHVAAGVLTCPDCGEFWRNGNGGWARRGHSCGVAVREALDFPAELLADLPMQTALVCDRAGDRVVHDATELRGASGTVGEWLEARGEWLRAVSTGDERR